MDPSTRRLAVKLNKLLNEADGENGLELKSTPKPGNRSMPLKSTSTLYRCSSCGAEESMKTLGLKPGDYTFHCNACGKDSKVRYED